MSINKKFLIILFIFLFVNIAVVSANDLNSTDNVQLDDNGTVELKQDSNSLNKISESDSSENGTDDNDTVEKTTPTITIKSNKLYTKDSLEIYMCSSECGGLEQKNITATLNNKQYSLETNSKGFAYLNINLPAKTYKLTLSFDGDDEYNPLLVNFNLEIVKLKTKITESANFVVRGNYLYFHLTDNRGDAVSGKKITIKFNGKTYNKKTNKNGKVKLKIKKSNARHVIKTKFKGDKQYKGSSRNLKFYVTSSRSIKIGNTKLLKNGYLRVYLKISGKAVSKKVILTIGNKKLTKKSNKEGIVVFRPKMEFSSNLKQHPYTAKVKVGKYYSKKNLKCYDYNVKDPLKESIPVKNGLPDTDWMPGSYVMGDDNAKYTLKKSQYKEVLKRDSYCLFLHGKLTKYVFFKTKNHPKLNNIIKREKWNVIERAINAKLVKKNKNGYWPGKITVSLKGKSYTYPYVRDVQRNGYTCGPTSCSMCSQVLKNYVCEKYLAKLAGTNSQGTTCGGMIKALGKNNFQATYYYKSTFNSALNELKKGGVALIFHANKHYVSILDISSNGKKVLVSNSYGTYDGIPTKWVKVSVMKKKFSPQWTESLIVKLNYKLFDSTKNSINAYYNSFGSNWHKHNTNQGIGRI